MDNDNAINDSARASADLPIVRARTTTTRPMISMSEDEVYLRLNVPSGLQTNGKWPKTYGIDQDAEPNPSVSPIMHNDNSNDGGVSAKLAAAKATLAGAQNSNVSARPAPVVKRAKAPISQPTPSGPSLSDELAAKRKNVDDYAGSN